MEFGIHLPQSGRKAGPDAIRRAARQADELGWDDVWVNDHLAVPEGAAYPPSAVFFKPIVTLTCAAAAMQRVRLGTSVLVLPLRYPVHLAKEVATLDLLSEGRVILGAGVGWLREEFEALGVPPAQLRDVAAARVPPTGRAAQQSLGARENVGRHSCLLLRPYGAFGLEGRCLFYKYIVPDGTMILSAS